MESSLVITFFLLTICFIVVCLLLSYFANRATKENKADLLNYRSQLTKIRRKRSQIRKHTEWQWPIWPRPLLFEEIDRSTQLALARTENNIEEIEEINEAIMVIPPFPSTIDAIFDVNGNINRLTIHSKNKKLLRAFSKKSQEIQDAERIIYENRRKIDRLKKDIQKKIEQRKEEITEKSYNLNYLQKLGEVRFSDVYQNILSAQSCLNYAELEIASAEQDDLVEWVAAEQFSEAGDLALEIFNLKSHSYSFSETYEADEVLSRLAQITTDLEGALSAVKPHNWKLLIELHDRLSGFRAEIENAGKLLTDFEAACRKLKDLIAQLKAINVARYKERLFVAERDLGIYFGTPLESPELWRKNLSDQELPSLQLMNLRKTFESQIQPTIEGTVIRQSNSALIIVSLEWFLMELRKIDRLIIRIEKLYRYHNQCEKEIRFLISTTGETTLLIKRTSEFADNTAREVKKGCQEGKRRYERFIDRANGPTQKADFPNLLIEVKNLEKELRDLIIQHETVISKLQVEALDYYRKINELEIELMDIRQKPPAIERDWDVLFNDFARVMKQYETTGKNYGLLVEYVSNARTLIDEKTRLKRGFQQQHDKFNSLYDENNRRITSALNVITGLLSFFKNEWSKPFSKTIETLNEQSVDYLRMKTSLQATKQNLPMDQARIVCESIRQELNDQERKNNETIESAKKSKSDLERLDKQVNTLFNRRGNKNPVALAEARQLVDSAREAEDPQTAKGLLVKARGVLENIGLYLPPVFHYSDNRKEISFFERVQNKVRVGDIKNVNRSRLTIGNKISDRSRGNTHRRRN